MSGVGNVLDNPGNNARQKAAAGSGWYAALARTGLVAKGVSFALVGVLAVKVALGDGGKATSRQGALQSIAHHSFGKIILIVLAIGFACYALWRFVEAFAERADGGKSEDEAKKWVKRAGYIGRGLIYAGLTYSTLRIVSGSGGGQSQDSKAHKSTAMVLGWTGGRWIVGAVGLVVIGVGLWNLYRGLARKFEDKWRVQRLGHTARVWGGRAGVLGHIARFVVFGLIGVFLVKAAVDYKPSDAIGLDGALQKLSHASYGPWLLGVTAVGLVAYGIYCFVDAALRDVSTNA